MPPLDRAIRLADTLGLEFYIGPPRASSDPENLYLGARNTDRGLSPTHLSDLESSARTLNRVVAEAGGDPIPEDLRRALLRLDAERAVEPEDDDADRPGEEDDARPGRVAEPAEGDGLADRDAPADALGRHDAGPPGDSLTVPFAQDVRTAAGAGEMVFEEAADLHITVSRSLLPGWARPSRLACIRAVGDSMEPTLHDGDLILLDRSHIEPLDGHVFVAHTGDGLVVKRLRHDGHRWELASDNPAYPPRPAGDGARVVGRVAWSGPLRTAGARASPGRRSGDDLAC